LAHGRQQQVIPEHVFRNTIRQVESLGSQLVRDRAVKKTTVPPPPAISMLSGTAVSPHAMLSSNAMPSMYAEPSPNIMPHGQPTPPAHLMKVDLNQAFNPEPLNAELCLSSRISLFQQTPSPVISRISPTAVYEWLCPPRTWKIDLRDEVTEQQAVIRISDLEENESQLPRLPHCLLSD
jgi:hypothetical protein